MDQVRGRDETREDGNAWHFMRRVPAMAMGANDLPQECRHWFGQDHLQPGWDDRQ